MLRGIRHAVLSSNKNQPIVSQRVKRTKIMKPTLTQKYLSKRIWIAAMSMSNLRTRRNNQRKEVAS